MKLLLSVILFLIVSCNKNYRQINLLPNHNSHKIKLCNSNYFIDLPVTFYLDSCAVGKEGQIRYSIYDYVDSTNLAESLSIGIEIDQGQRLLDKIYDWGTLVEKVSSTIMNKHTVWKIYKTETGRFVGYTKLRKIWLEVSTPQQQSIDTLINISSSLKRG